jgi:hypothetical protein
VSLARRVPNPTAAWDAASTLARRLEVRWPTVTVLVNDNRRSLLRSERGATTVRVSVHWSLLGDLDALLAWIHTPSAAHWAPLEARAAAAREASVRTAPARPTQGRVHDLDAIAAAEHARLRLDLRAQVGWGQWSGTAPRRHLRLGSCLPGTPPMVRIHPVLDHADVPDWYVSFIVFHELLHLVHPTTRSAAGRRVVHGPAFRRAERDHPRFQDAHAWEAHHISALLSRARAVVSAR